MESRRLAACRILDQNSAMTLRKNLFVLATLFCTAAGGAERVAVDRADCRPAPPSVGHYTRGWIGWEDYIDLCPIHPHTASSTGSPVIILTIRIDRYQRDHGVTPELPGRHAPRALVLDQGFNEIGELRGPFPGGYPGDTRLVFTDWRGGFPWRIEMREIDAAALDVWSRDEVVRVDLKR